MAEKTYTVTLALPDGSRKYFRGRTKKEAEKKRDDAKLQLGMGVDISNETTVKELADTWYYCYKECDEDLHKRSKETIRNTVNRYIVPAIGNMKVIDVKPIHFQQLMTSVSKYSKSTQKKVLQMAKSIFEVGVENGMIPKVPISKQTKAGGAEPSEPKPLTEAQSAALLKAVEGTRAHLLIRLLLASGLRIGEALGLQWNDIDFKEGTVSVNRSIVYPEDNRAGEINEEMKTENAQRTIPIPWPVVDELKEARSKSNSVWVFSMQNGSFLSYYSYRSLWKIVEYRSVSTHKEDQREIVPRVLDFDVHPHLLRHTCITRWFEAGLDIKEIQYLAGHSNVDITLGIYTHYQEAERRKDTAKRIRAAM